MARGGLCIQARTPRQGITLIAVKPDSLGMFTAIPARLALNFDLAKCLSCPGTHSAS